MKVAVHLHIFYLDLVRPIKEALDNIPCGFDLYVSIPEAIKYGEEDLVNTLASISNVQQIVIKNVPNRGRDIAPMVCTFKESLVGYDVLLHLHTKKSPHEADLSNWLFFICHHLLHRELTPFILKLLEDGAGMVAPPNFIGDSAIDGWGKGNLEIAQQVINRSALKIDLKKEFPVIDYPHGSMFWAKTSFLKSLFDIPFTYTDFPEEPIGADGTMAHALERLLFVFGIANGGKAYKIYFSEEERDVQARYEKLHVSLLRTQEKNKKHLRVIRFLIVYLSVMGLSIVALLSYIFLA